MCLNITGKRGNVQINNASQAGIEPLPNELKRYPTSAVLVVVLVSPNHYNSNTKNLILKNRIIFNISPLQYFTTWLKLAL